MNSTPKIAITGASGFLGSALVNHFSNNKFKVVALCRNIPIEKLNNVQYSVFDLNGKIDMSVFKKLDYFIHCAYIKAENDKAALDKNIEGAKRLLELCKENKVNKKIFISSLSAMPRQLSVYGRQKSQIEKLFSGPNDLIIRPGLIIGNGGLMKSIINQIKNHTLIPLIDDGKQKIQTIFINDLIAIIDDCLKKNISGNITVAESEAIEFRIFLKYICNCLFLKRLFLPLPYWIIYNTVRLLNGMGIHLSISMDNLMGLKQSDVAEVSHYIEETGIRIRTYQESISRILTE